MRGFLETAGEYLAIECSPSWVADLVAEGAGGQLESAQSRTASVHVHIEEERRAFDTRGWQLLARGAWRRNGEVVIENACTSGFDLHFNDEREQPEFTYRWRPPARERAAAHLLRTRFRLLARATLMQYPVLWCAGLRACVPLHASACVVGAATPLVVAQSGIGRSTLLLAEVARGGHATGDNLAVTDGSTVWGMVEPARAEGGGGRSVTHGRRERPFPHSVPGLVPDRIVVVERGAADEASLSACSGDTAARSLVTSTYMAGELRRYWPFAATLAAGSGRGPSHPAIADVVSALTARLPASLLRLGRRGESCLSELLNTVEVAA